ncbi:MAG: hypothetical protein K0U98_06670 [Deltaproteobacteria bacterium]|nr:hypothetical protein [Deltaproteobacteria bacterium]
MLELTNFYRPSRCLSVPVLAFQFLVQIGFGLCLPSAALATPRDSSFLERPSLASPSSASPSVADLRLEWAEGRGGEGPSGSLGGSSPQGGEIHGTEGEAVSVAYRLRNIGGSNAFAAVVESWTALGREGRPLRLQPGPAAGEIQKRHLELALASGMRELCVEVRLQTLEAGSPGDPNPKDNRICRRVIVQPSPEAHSPPQTEGRTR